MSTPDEPLLLTPGPLTTSRETKAAMLRDWGSRDAHFIALNARIRDRLADIAGGAESHVCVPIQGSGTFAIEATVGTLLPRVGKMLILVRTLLVMPTCIYLIKEVAFTTGIIVLANSMTRGLMFKYMPRATLQDSFLLRW